MHNITNLKAREVSFVSGGILPGGCVVKPKKIKPKQNRTRPIFHTRPMVKFNAGDANE